MDLGSSRYVAQIVTRGRANQDHRVSQYKVQHSTDGIAFTEVQAIFEGNSDRSTRVFATLPEPVLARYVRLVPQRWNMHPCMRAAVIVQEVPVCTTSGSTSSTSGDMCWDPPAGIEGVVLDLTFDGGSLADSSGSGQVVEVASGTAAFGDGVLGMF